MIQEQIPTCGPGKGLARHCPKGLLQSLSFEQTISKNKSVILVTKLSSCRNVEFR